MKLKDLKKWENELNICIRCGYCYEDCHIFKILPWESNSPRGKLILIYGLINGDIEPSSHVSEKIFECFFCKLCENNCSANVSVTDILTDVREALIESGYESDGTTALIDEDICSGCGICISVCKPEANTLEEDEDGKKKAVVDKSKCEGCGVCIAACPSRARKLRPGYKVTEEELLEQMIKKLESTHV